MIPGPSASALLALALILGCSGLTLFPSSELVDVDRATAVAQGFDVPAGAEHVYVRDEPSLDVRATWFRYRLPPDEVEALTGQLDADPALTSGAGPPDLGGWSLHAPGWWAPSPSGRSWRRDRPDGGTWWGLHERDVLVVLWQTPT